MTDPRLLVLASSPVPLYPAGDEAMSPVPLWLGVLFGVLVVVSSFVVLLPRVRHALDRVWSRRPRRFRQ
ncbi:MULTISPECIES: hypothetical protein [unclassified Frigoribacterium]|uniref:hypothetical protein n=1 Tax=unclassified Frigoribacterium TaxID=2627005 RepID=UPI00156633E3|nr:MULTISPECIES: hypothetical protein [unclassified Frigoribacterium]NQW86193.1 hypothetical protein [Frigoribacterium sp. VKM Ac-2860]NQX07525.1 hypothetical protein [Frigoribacterium sp. VKM Ac-2859]